MQNVLGMLWFSVNRWHKKATLGTNM